MARKPTGRPPGRPKTKDYETLLARVPSDLADEVKRYAARHRCSVAELIRDGLVWRIEQDTPGRPWSAIAPLDADNLPSMLDNGDTGIHEISPMLHAAIQTAVRETLQMVLPGLHGDQGERVIQQPIPVLQHNTGESQQAAAPGYDPSRCLLGPLCVNGHDYAGTGQSLRSRLGKQECVLCKRERDAAYKARRKATQA